MGTGTHSPSEASEAAVSGAGDMSLCRSQPLAKRIPAASAVPGQPPSWPAGTPLSRDGKRERT
ncbi:hypothetical protein GCM10010329_54780 [Streptomyces spiroverticillatus]|nr:hypothetical protein GCM10010329_54780 [Streptomyces spiroverticillatus]